MSQPGFTYWILIFFSFISCKEVDPQDCSGIIPTEYRFLLEVQNNLTGTQFSVGDTLSFEMSYPQEVIDQVSGKSIDILALDFRHIVVFKNYDITNDHHYYYSSSKARFEYELPLGEFADMNEYLYNGFDLQKNESLLIKPILLGDQYKIKLLVKLSYPGKYFIYWKKGNTSSERIGYNVVAEKECEWFTTLYANPGTNNIQELYREDQVIIRTDEKLPSESAFMVFEVI